MGAGADRQGGVSDCAEAGPATVLLLENQPDHAGIILEALAAAWPRLRLTWSASKPPDVRLPPPDVLLLSLSSDLAAARSHLSFRGRRLHPPPVIFLRGVDERWSPADLGEVAGATSLDKREGSVFLRRLADAVAEATRVRTAAEQPPAVPPPPTVTHVPRAGGPPVRRADEPPADESSAPPADRGDAPPAPRERATALVTGLLVEALDRLLADVAPLVNLFRGRFPQDAATLHYAASLERELSRARAIGRRLAAVGGAGPQPLPRRFAVIQLLTLRGPAWRVLAPPGVEVEVATGESAPVIEILPDVLGAALDDLVLQLFAAAPASSRLRIESDLAIVDDLFAAGRPGLSSGRFARLRLRIDEPGTTSAPPVADRTPPGERTLARALAAVKAHGGFLELLRGGSPPRLQQANVYLPALTLSGASLGPTPAAPGGCVLFVEDERSVRQVGLEMLHSGGFTAQGAASGEEAVALFEAGCRYDLVLLDWTLGGLPGGATFERIRALAPQVPVILVSGAATPARLRRLFDEGLLGFVPKPFGLRQLIDAVQAALGVS